VIKFAIGRFLKANLPNSSGKVMLSGFIKRALNEQAEGSAQRQSEKTCRIDGEYLA
jgi:hypothetical protein